jgi:DNA-binding PucR family transcriptional regulator
MKREGKDQSGQRSSVEARARIAEGLRKRCAEIEREVLEHVRAMPGPVEGDAEYLAGLRATVAAVVDYGLMGIEQGKGWCEPIPSAALAQAHRAARGGVGQEMVLRRYVVGYTVFDDFVIREAERGGLLDQGPALRYIRGTLASLLDCLLASITEEYARETKRIKSSPRLRRAEDVRRLLAGEQVDLAGLGYEFDAWHLGLIATGALAEQVLQGLAIQLEQRLLWVSIGEKTVWAWVSGRHSIASADIEGALESAAVSMAVGEPGYGVQGFCLTHRQAQAALGVALHRPRQLTRYGDVALIAHWLQDEALARSFIEVHLSPLGGYSRNKLVLRETLRAYFAADSSTKVAAARLGVHRRTVQNRRRIIEERLGYLLCARRAELEVALRLDDLLRKSVRH